MVDDKKRERRRRPSCVRPFFPPICGARAAEDRIQIPNAADRGRSCFSGRIRTMLTAGILPESHANFQVWHLTYHIGTEERQVVFARRLAAVSSSVRRRCASASRVQGRQDTPSRCFRLLIIASKENDNGPTLAETPLHITLPSVTVVTMLMNVETHRSMFTPNSSYNNM